MSDIKEDVESILAGTTYTEEEKDAYRMGAEFVSRHLDQANELLKELFSAGSKVFHYGLGVNLEKNMEITNTSELLEKALKKVMVYFESKKSTEGIHSEKNLNHGTEA